MNLIGATQRILCQAEGLECGSWIGHKSLEQFRLVRKQMLKEQTGTQLSLRRH